jgi:hypothetical protein
MRLGAAPQAQTYTTHRNLEFILLSKKSRTHLILIKMGAGD